MTFGGRGMWWEIGLMALASLLGAGAQILFRKGMLSWQLTVIAIGLVLYGIGFLINMLVYRSGSIEASRLYPVIALSYLWVAVLAAIYLGERFTIGKMVGSLLIISGVAMMGFL